MIRCRLVEHVTSRPHNAGGGMTYFEISSKLNKAGVTEGNCFCAQLDDRPVCSFSGDAREPLDDKPDLELEVVSDDGVVGKEVRIGTEKPDEDTAMRPSGTW